MKKRGKAAFWSAKKGVAIDLDWIISLGLFLIYLGVFFIILRQIPSQHTPAESLLNNVYDEIIDSTKWGVQRLPLFVTSNISGIEPIITGFAQDWKNFSFSDNTSFDLKDGRLIFVKRLDRGKNIIELVSSSENYTQPAASFDLAASPTSASVNGQRFTSEFSNAMLSRAAHFEKERLGEFNISISGLDLKPETAVQEANITGLSAKYKITFPQLNHTSIIVAGYPRIFNYVNTDAREPHDLTVSATVRNYTFFHFNNAASGTLNYTKTGCTTSLSRYLDFYDDLSGVTFIAPEGANMSFCTGNSSVRLSVQFEIGNETRYDIIFHEGDFNSTLKYVSPYRTAFGIVENITGISKRLYQKVNETNYDTLKGRWKYPSSREFSFTLSNESGAVIFNYQPKASGITNVFAKEADVFIIDNYGLKLKHKLRIRGW